MPNTSPINDTRFDNFITQLTELIEGNATQRLPEKIKPLLMDLVAQDDWLEAAYRQPHPDHYQQYLLYKDIQNRFSVVAFVWGPGQYTPIHDHQVWGVIGMLSGAEQSQSYRQEAREMVLVGAPVVLRPGDVEILSPETGDIHQVSNYFNDQVSISIHIYGSDIGTVNRFVYTPEGKAKSFISGYANSPLPAQ